MSTPRIAVLVAIGALVALFAWTDLLPGVTQAAAGESAAGPGTASSVTTAGKPPVPATAPAPGATPGSSGLERAIFAGGCFWCMEPPFDKLDGVVSTTSGYAGGRTENPTYEEVSAGGTGHAEAVEVLYDPSKVSYEKLLDVYWHNVDPSTPNRQFCDSGRQYRTAILYRGDEQRRLAEMSKAALEQSGRLASPVVTEIVAVGKFYPAEEYHQDYYLKNPVRYKYYRYSCGRDQRLRELWGESRAPTAGATPGG